MNSPRILVVDDERELLEGLEEYLAENGYEVTTAIDGEAGLAAARANPLDLVLLDIRMPGLDGREVCRRLRQMDSGLPIILLTAVNEEDLARQVMEIGAYDYITKPIDLNYLRTSVVIKIIDMFGSEKVEWEP